MTKPSIKELLLERVLVLDGAMGTMIQKRNLTENDYRSERFKDWPVPLKGNNDLLVLTQPDIIRDIHKAYFDAGADIVTTNSFSMQSVSMSEYRMEGLVEELNRAAVRIVRDLAVEYGRKNPDRPRYVAGSVGPTGVTASLSPDVNDPALRSIDFDTLEAAYAQQIEVMIQEGVDLLLLETIFDTLNAKAAVSAAQKTMTRLGKEVPIMLSVTVSNKGGRTLSGQTMKAFCASLMHTSTLLSFGLNCSFGAKDLEPILRELSDFAPCFVSAHPNAGLPNEMGAYDQTPEKMAQQVAVYLQDGLVNIIGGCCGTTPEHIAAYQPLLASAVVRKPSLHPKGMWVSGLELLEVTKEMNFINIGERCNVAGSKKFLNLIKAKEYDKALHIALEQVENGAQIIDVNMDDGLLDTAAQMVHFLRLIGSEPSIAKVPVMIDSSKFEVLEEGIKQLQGKSLINSISLKEGEDLFLDHARRIRSLGAAVVVMAFDEQGQADSFERKIQICERAYRLLTEKVGFDPHDIIFDPNVLSIATGMEEHNNYAVDFIRATAWIKEHLKGAKVSGGVSNLSFSFRGNNYIREAMHAVFLYHAIQAGLDMAIVNPNTALTYQDIPADILTLIEDVVLNKDPQAAEKLLSHAQSLKNKTVEGKSGADALWRTYTVEERLAESLVKGVTEYLQEDLQEVLKSLPQAINIIEGPLMWGMKRVGELFESGKMFLPQVVKTARTMKAAVEILQPVLQSQKEGSSAKGAGRFVMATVKGDVHDIGKNIVGVVMACNNFEVIDLGVMVPAEDIVAACQREHADLLGLSGLITPSLDEMAKVISLMEKEGLSIPILIGGATTSALHTAIRLAPLYSGVVMHVKDASMNAVVATELLSARKEQVIASLKQQQAQLASCQQENPPTLCSWQSACQKRYISDSGYIPNKPNELGVFELNIPVQTVYPYINWRAFFHVWQLGGRYADVVNLHSCKSCHDQWIASFSPQEQPKAALAIQLYQEADHLLSQWMSQDSSKTIQALYGLFPAKGEEGLIRITDKERVWDIPTLRQQSADKEVLLSLSDFVATDDYIGAFAITAGLPEETTDDYQKMLQQTLLDRLVEASSEWLHQKVRQEFWGYDRQEDLSVEELFKSRYKGIRPAIGYPSLPDQSIAFILQEILQLSSIGIQVTESGAMYPNASVLGFYIGHPDSSYFRIDKIDRLQLEDYARKRKMPLHELEKFLIHLSH